MAGCRANIYIYISLLVKLDTNGDLKSTVIKTVADKGFL
jgi:hypothetical protein